MEIMFSVLKAGDLEWLRHLRNYNRLWFIDTEMIEYPGFQNIWFAKSTNNGDLNLIIRDVEFKNRVGFISLYDMSQDGRAKIGRMMVEDAFKHQGYMTKALIKIFDIAKNHFRISELLLEVKNEDIIARNLFVNMGFITYGITADTLIMRKML